MKKNQIILLFDIDGTLIKTGMAGKKAMEATFDELFQVKNSMKDISFAGSTDLDILHQAFMSKQGKTFTPDQEQIFRQKYLSLLKKNLMTEPEGQEILPGAKNFLEHCINEKNIYLGLVTGNYKEGAKIKLEHFGLWHYFQEGAFGCDHADRNLLPAIALERIQKQQNHLPSKQRIWIIGDTVKDVQCAKANQINSLIALTGFSSEEELRKEQPSKMVKNLTTFQNFLNEIDLL